MQLNPVFAAQYPCVVYKRRKLWVAIIEYDLIQGLSERGRKLNVPRSDCRQHATCVEKAPRLSA